VLWTSLAGILLFVRYPDWFLRPRLWAEDFVKFFLDARCIGNPAIFQSYSGYIHLIPRLIAWVGARLDPAIIPTFYLSASFAFTLLVVARVFSPRLDLPGKPLLALAIVAVPHTGEVFLSITNIQWIAALALVLTLLMRDPAGPLEWAGDISVLILAGLTGPFSLFIFPFFVLRALYRATNASRVLLAAELLAALVQELQILRNTAVAIPGQSVGAISPLNLVAVLSSRIPLALIGAQGWAYRVDRAFVICAGVAGASAIAAMALAQGSHRRERICILLFAVLLIGFTTAKIRIDAWDYREMVDGDRYFYLPKVMLLWVIVCWLCRKQRESLSPAIVVAAAGLFCVSMIPYVEPGDFKTRHVERPYYAWDIYCVSLRKGESVEVEVSPGWKHVVPARVAKR
jgi:hypothetical protein